MAGDSLIRVAVFNDYELVVRGVATLLECARDKIKVVELGAGKPVDVPVDVLLLDLSTTGWDWPHDMTSLCAQTEVGALAIFMRSVGPEQVAQAQAHGARGVLSKALTGEALADALVRIHSGEFVVEPALGAEKERGDCWPGELEGLSARQAEIVGMICQGLSNEEIAKHAYLSINTVKSYIRMAYRTMGVTSRSQAVLWGLDHGLAPDRRRTSSSWPVVAGSRNLSSP